MSRFLVAVVLGLMLALGACAAEEKKQTASSARPLLEAYVSAWNRHDSLALDTLIAKDGIHEDVSSDFRAVGAAGVNGLLSDFIKASPDFQWRMTKVIEDGPNLATEWTWASTYTGPSPSGPVTAVKVFGRGASIVEVADGKIKRFSNYCDEASLFPKVKTDSTKTDSMKR
ncbi:MAG: ester cyclase [Gemmatimonadales bacterium]